MDFYPTISCGELGKYTQVKRALFPCSSWANYNLKWQEKNRITYKGVIGKIKVPQIPDCITDRAVDCGGFVATKKWGEYKYSIHQYVEWTHAINPVWGACMDFCCEDEITTGNRGIVTYRQDKTTELAHTFFSEYKAVPWVWVPTIQGWNIEDYIKHATDLDPLIRDMQDFYNVQGKGDVFRVGIGTLCARKDLNIIRDVVTAVSKVLPNIKFHLWGVKLAAFKLNIPLDRIVSSDSAAWNGMIKTGRNKWKSTPYSQREWCFKVALPEYEEKLNSYLC